MKPKEPQKPRVLGLVGSVRARMEGPRFQAEVAGLGGMDQAYDLIYRLASERRISNTEGAMIAAAAGVLNQGAAFAAVRVADHLGGDGPGLAELARRHQAAEGLVVASPVYFGDRSSQIQAWLEAVAGSGSLPLMGQVVGFVSVGAKRNGGQETTNILGLADCMALGASVVGNGPPTSQFGGTIQAGDLGSVLDDNFGLQTAFGTGKHVGRLIGCPPAAGKGPKPRLLVIYTARPPKGLKALLAESLPAGLEVEELCLDDWSLGRCLACSPCPPLARQDSAYPCAQDDDMQRLRQALLAADGLLIVGALCGGRDLLAWQVFAERTRFIRRHDFELSDLPMGLVQCLDRPGQGNFGLRAVNLCLRHNAIMVGPGHVMLAPAGRARWPEPGPLAAYLVHLKDQVRRFKVCRGLWRGQFRYEAVGYAR